MGNAVERVRTFLTRENWGRKKVCVLQSLITKLDKIIKSSLSVRYLFFFV